MKTIKWISFVFFLLACQGIVHGEEKYAFSFKKFATNHPDLRMLQGKESIFSLDGEGLVLELPAGRKSPALDGVVTKFDIRGDFEITFAFDQLSLLGKTSPVNSSVAIWLSLDSEPKLGATMSRSFRVEGPRFVANKITFEKSGEKMTDRYDSLMTVAPADQTSGKLRVSRKGGILTHLATTGLDQEFQLLRTWEMGTADVTTMRFQVNPGGLDKGLKVRLLEMEIIADALIPKSGGKPPKTVVSGPSLFPQGDTVTPPEKTRTPLWVWILIPGVLVVTGGILSAWLLRAKTAKAGL